MKIRIILGALVLLVSGQVSASPLYYTFSGSVNRSFDVTGVINDTFGTSDIAGNPVEYVFLVDFEVQGLLKLNDGTTYTLRDSVNSVYELDNFFSDLISGSLLDEKDGGSYNSPKQAAAYIYGSSGKGIASTTPNATRLLAGSADNRIDLLGRGLLFNEWIVGTSIIAEENSFDSNNQYSVIASDLILTRISPSLSPVPAPAAIWLFGTGLIGLVGFSKRRKAA
ncbi:VPLPA-CTERM sorting domain-containing protein [Pseudomonadota bacterium]